MSRGGSIPHAYAETLNIRQETAGYALFLDDGTRLQLPLSAGGSVGKMQKGDRVLLDYSALMDHNIVHAFVYRNGKGAHLDCVTKFAIGTYEGNPISSVVMQELTRGRRK